MKRIIYCIRMKSEDEFVSKQYRLIEQESMKRSNIDV